MYVCMYDGLMDGFGSCLPGEYKCHDDTAKLHLAYNRSIQRRALKSLTCLWTYLIMAQPWKKIYVHICVCMNVCGVVYTCVCGYACLRIWMQRPGVKIVIHCSPLFKFLKISDMVCACSMHMGECCIAVSMHAETRGGCFVFLFSLPLRHGQWARSLPYQPGWMSREFPWCTYLCSPNTIVTGIWIHTCSLHGCDGLECSTHACTAQQALLPPAPSLQQRYLIFSDRICHCLWDSSARLWLTSSPWDSPASVLHPLWSTLG